MTEEKYITIQEAAEILGVSRVTVWNKVRAGLIPCVTLTGGKYSSYRLLLEDIEEIKAIQNVKKGAA
jgi:excisionase family DNA binding protein